MLLGTYTPKLDDKGRVILPAKFRTDLGDGVAVTGGSTAPDIVPPLGPERGWSARDRNALRSAGFTLVHLGPRVLRAETATVAAVAILKARLGWL